MGLIIQAEHSLTNFRAVLSDDVTSRDMHAWLQLRRQEFCGLPALAVCEWKETAEKLLVEANAAYYSALLTRVLALIACATISIVCAVLLPLDTNWMRHMCVCVYVVVGSALYRQNFFQDLICKMIRKFIKHLPQEQCTALCFFGVEAFNNDKFKMHDTCSLSVDMGRYIPYFILFKVQMNIRFFFLWPFLLILYGNT